MRFLVVLALLNACVGCAFESGYLRTSNPVVGSVEQAQGRGQTFVVTVEDARNDKNRIGIKKNGYGMETANIYADGSVDTWLRDSFAATLVDAGYKPASAEMPATWRMRLRVLDVFTENTPQAWDVQYGARVSVELVVTTTDGRTWARRFTGLEMESRVIEAKVEIPMQELLHRACQEAMGKAVRALTELAVTSPQDRGY
jgi:uncharacterized lipoprotein YajG